MSSQSYSSTARASLSVKSPTSSDLTPNFADPNFDPADFLNDSLSPLTVASLQPNASRAPGSVPLTELSAQVQTLLSQISAQNVRLSSTLSQLSDEILRSGGRLAYEVEVLRGETIGLSETLTEVLRDDIAKFVTETPNSTAASAARKDKAKDETTESATATKDEKDEEDDEDTDEAALEKDATMADPEYITNLRTLNQVRSRLENVVQTFGDAMEWPLPPSEISFSSSFISVSGPDISVEGSDQEAKGQEIMKKLRTETLELLDSEGGGRAGLEAATRRVETLRTLAAVWKGSAEEKARYRFVDNLARLVDERRRNLEHQQAMADQNQRGPKSRSEQRRDSDSGAPAGGLFRNLQRLKEEIYLE